MRIYVALTALLGGLPFLIYGWGRRFGALPSEAEWHLSGWDGIPPNHGPCNGTWQGGVVSSSWLPLFVLLIATAVCFCVFFRSLTLRKLGVFLFLFLSQGGALYGQLAFLIWAGE
jgi:hypothetical protein